MFEKSLGIPSLSYLTFNKRRRDSLYFHGKGLAGENSNIPYNRAVPGTPARIITVVTTCGRVRGIGRLSGRPGRARGFVSAVLWFLAQGCPCRCVTANADGDKVEISPRRPARVSIHRADSSRRITIQIRRRDYAVRTAPLSPR
ncbi:hypothetical protein EVAR_95752_1 [Eumeta japonica]|uniref:Uncharacterized protein n=1 Tax=Eumeta variegata TaxID=151549 RepID=A0A4C1ULW6_EUMVA|nr:hypothetical protein EVAR_95752_1 [Eumeta japonica]